MKNRRLSHMRCLIAGLSIALCALYFAACDNLVGRMEWATYTIVYHANDGTGRTRTSHSIRHGDSHYIKENVEGQVFVHGGHAFESWRMLRDGRYFEGGESVERLATSVGETIDLHAIWRPNTFRIRFNANGGSGEMKDGRVFTFGESGQSLLPNDFNPPTAESFLGWAKSPDPGSPILIPEEEDGGPVDHRLVPEYDGAYVTLFARWGSVIIFNANGGSGEGPARMMVNAGEGVILPNQQEFSRPGHVFGGWNTMSNGFGETFAPGVMFVPSGDITLFAVWHPEGTVFTVTFDANDGLGTGPSALRVNAGAVAILPNCQGLTRAGYVFVGWNTCADGGGINYPAGARFTVTGDVTLYAVWRKEAIAVSFAVVFVANGGEGNGPETMTAGTGESVILPNQQELTKAGHVFVGWNTGVDGGGINYPAGARFTVTGDVTLYAVWRLGPPEGGEGVLTLYLPPDFQDMAPVILNKTLSLIRLHTVPVGITIVPPQGAEGVRWIFGGRPITETTGENWETFVSNNGATIVFGPRIHGKLLGVSGEHFLAVEVNVNGLWFGKSIRLTVIP